MQQANPWHVLQTLGHVNTVLFLAGEQDLILTILWLVGEKEDFMFYQKLIGFAVSFSFRVFFS